ncbi:hypothetical protein SAMN05216282_12247 [Cryobacterium psychrotolerans]|uniref:Uncharacterized protein n=1 Tax=Cryobacterium psychrotolerans TaxID=386301 RepID=A0A1G9GLL2_9MICO|nr:MULTISPECIES: hypothetical protein [Cryobacterium]TFD45886.1 hypothetical protein E3T33_06470 [Cryobacterium sp. TMT1-2-1]TFD83577.1 hypothetical protein E3T56_12180 [Cryobacterium psychrotolerans]SDL01163.1 hypothetical protein SAMN05216282_12247 [Cryobacterium psychrotolerans]
MNPVVRTWLAFAAIGAALVHLAVGAGAPLPLAIILVGLGLAELGWGVVTLIRGRVTAPDATVALALVPVFLWGATAILGSGLGVTADATGLPFYPMAVASLFDITLACSLALSRRSNARRATTDAAPSPRADVPAAPPRPQAAWSFLAALMIGGMLFSGLTTSALAATRAGEYAVPHGSHSTPGTDNPSGSHTGHDTGH